jgi:hypothetical protein
LLFEEEEEEGEDSALRFWLLLLLLSLMVMISNQKQREQGESWIVQQSRFSVEIQCQRFLARSTMFCSQSTAWLCSLHVFIWVLQFR